MAKKSNKSLLKDRGFQFVSAIAAVFLVLCIAYAGTSTQGSSSAAKRGGGTTTVQSLRLSPAQANTTPGSVITTTIYENSGTVPINVVQVALTYPADQLEYFGIDEGDIFTSVASTDTTTPGMVRIARSLPEVGSVGVAGERVVATVSFKVLPSASGNVALGFNTDQSMLVSTADNLNVAGNTAGATYRIRNR